MTPSLAGGVIWETKRRGLRRHIFTDPGLYAEMAKHVKVK
jgi:hypothetical protein